MKSEQRERSPLEGEALREIELSVHGKLRAHHLSEAFIERYGEDAIQRGVAEYLSAKRRGVAVEHRDAFIVDVAYKRALDELRREARFSSPSAIEMLAESRTAAGPATEELAIEALQIEQMRQAIETLRPEDRQVLSLFYFEERSATDIAALLHLSERSLRRRLRRATERLGHKLGVKPPEPGSTLAIEIGVLSWVSLGGARVAVARGRLEQVLGSVESAHQWMGRLFASGDGERFTALASGPAGKVASGCAGAAIVCVLGGVVGPGVGGITGNSSSEPAPRPHARQAAIPSAPRAISPAIEPERPRVPTSRSTQTSRPAETRKPRRAAARQAEKEQVERQTSGIARATQDSSTSGSGASGSSSETSEPEAVVTPPPSSSASEAEEAQAEQEFGAFK